VNASHLSRSPAETRALAAALLPRLAPGDVLLLHGDLGSGKTCFVQGLAEALGWSGPVNSPTFSLVQEYPTRPPLVHADLYRLADAAQIWDTGLEEILDAPVLLAVEWSERCPAFWPANAWHLRFETLDDAPDSRRIHIYRGGPA
jgi:tRNA threonylcarbamoyladenosine biosynthesis protein TsaE